ncbi:MAG TPA: MBL fold metallo-hydrolase [Actinomycetota bacterium]|nr:MBL fold metallo-hydrolase [Actinomycetota bacterium]
MLERITWFRQAAIRYAGEGLTLYIDPWGTTPDDPPADLILLTHAHYDHVQPREIQRLSGPGTKIVAPRDVARELSGDVTPVAPGQSHEVAGVRFETVPAYNIAEERLDMHPKTNNWVGYVIELDGRRYYHGGDTDALPELEGLRTDVAMVPIGGTYTMDYREAAGLVKAMEPKLAVPIHFGFVVCSPSHGALFKREAAPVPVEMLPPVNPFEQT